MGVTDTGASPPSVPPGHHGPAQNQLGTLRSWAVVLTGSLGDVARGMAIPPAIKRNVPGSSVTWVVDPRWAPYVALNRAVDRVIQLPKKWHFSAWRQGLLELRAAKPEVTLDLQRIFKSGFISWASGAGCRVGFDRRDGKECNWIFSNCFIPHLGEERSKLEAYGEFLVRVGASFPSSPDFGLGHLDHGPVLSALAEKHGQRGATFATKAKSYTVVVFGTAWRSKEWTSQGYAQLLQLLLSRTDRAVVLVGDAKWQQFADQQMKVLGSSRVSSFVGRTSLPELVSLLAHSAIAVGPDSGPGHVAASVGTPYVSLFGPTRPARTAPYGSESLVVRREIGCAPCYRKVCPGLGNLCMKLIEPEVVLKAIQFGLKA